jgi:hypothetical protein
VTNYLKECGVWGGPIIRYHSRYFRVPCPDPLQEMVEVLEAQRMALTVIDRIRMGMPIPPAGSQTGNPAEVPTGPRPLVRSHARDPHPVASASLTPVAIYNAQTTPGQPPEPRLIIGITHRPPRPIIDNTNNNMVPTRTRTRTRTRESVSDGPPGE